MHDHVLRVGEELVIPGHIRLTVLAVEEGKVVLGITGEPNVLRSPVARQWRRRLATMTATASQTSQGAESSVGSQADGARTFSSMSRMPPSRSREKQ